MLLTMTDKDALIRQAIIAKIALVDYAHVDITALVPQETVNQNTLGFTGDGVLRACIGDHLYRRFGMGSPGYMTVSLGILL